MTFNALIFAALAAISSPDISGWFALPSWSPTNVTERSTPDPSSSPRSLRTTGEAFAAMAAAVAAKEERQWFLGNAGYIEPPASYAGRNLLCHADRLESRRWVHTDAYSGILGSFPGLLEAMGLSGGKNRVGSSMAGAGDIYPSFGWTGATRLSSAINTARGGVTFECFAPDGVITTTNDFTGHTFAYRFIEQNIPEAATNARIMARLAVTNPVTYAASVGFDASLLTNRSTRLYWNRLAAYDAAVAALDRSRVPGGWTWSGAAVLTNPIVIRKVSGTLNPQSGHVDWHVEPPIVTSRFTPDMPGGEWQVVEEDSGDAFHVYATETETHFDLPGARTNQLARVVTWDKDDLWDALKGTAFEPRKGETNIWHLWGSPFGSAAGEDLLYICIEPLDSSLQPVLGWEEIAFEDGSDARAALTNMTFFAGAKIGTSYSAKTYLGATPLTTSSFFLVADPSRIDHAHTAYISRAQCYSNNVKVATNYLMAGAVLEPLFVGSEQDVAQAEINGRREAASRYIYQICGGDPEAPADYVEDLQDQFIRAVTNAQISADGRWFAPGYNGGGGYTVETRAGEDGFDYIAYSTDSVIWTVYTNAGYEVSTNIAGEGGAWDVRLTNTNTGESIVYQLPAAYMSPTDIDPYHWSERRPDATVDLYAGNFAEDGCDWTLGALLAASYWEGSTFGTTNDTSLAFEVTGGPDGDETLVASCEYHDTGEIYYTTNIIWGGVTTNYSWAVTNDFVFPYHYEYLVDCIVSPPDIVEKPGAEVWADVVVEHLIDWKWRALRWGGGD